jgi:hypothetical protein
MVALTGLVDAEADECFNGGQLFPNSTGGVGRRW